MDKISKKRKYKMTMNWYGEIHIFFRYANSEKQAFQLLLKQLCKQLSLTKYKVSNYLSNKPNCFEILEI